MDPSTAEIWPLIFYILLTQGFALAIIVPDPRTPSSRALAATVSMTSAWMIPYVVIRAFELPPLLQAWPLELVPAELGYIAAAEWILRVLRTAPKDRWSSAAITLLRVCQGAQLAVIALRLYYADTLNSAIGVLGKVPAVPPPMLDLLWICDIFSAVVLFTAMLLVIFGKPDLSERRRVLVIAAVLPFSIVSTFFQDEPMLWILIKTCGVLVGLVGIMQYHVSLGQRGEFLARFLSPQVRDQIRAQGFAQALDRRQLEITVVCCDLRGFTAFSQVHSSSEVADVLERYFAAVGAATARHGGTIKDFAGDGVLVLIGAPLPLQNHAQLGIALAQDARAAVEPVLQPYAASRQPLAIGIGAASGLVTVGAIKAADRFEYMAVGPAVNLAARLCANAGNGEVYVSERTAELAGGSGMSPCAPVALKGFGDAVPHFLLARGAA